MDVAGLLAESGRLLAARLAADPMARDNHQLTRWLMSPGAGVVPRARFGRPWGDDADCRDHLHLDWVPDPRSSVTEQRLVCAGCPVRSECLETAVRFSEGGLRGGLTEQERAELGQGAAA